MYIKKIRNVMSINIPSEPTDISNCANKMTSDIVHLISSYNSEAEKYKKHITDFKEHLEVLEKENTVSKGFLVGAERLHDISSIVNFNFSVSTACNEAKVIEQTDEEIAVSIFNEIENLVNSESIQDFEIDSLLSIASDIHNAAYITKSSFERHIVEYNIIKANINKNMEIFDYVYQDYYAQIIEYMSILNRNNIQNAVILKPEEKYKFASIKDVETELEYYTAEARRLDERSYVIDQIHEVMEMFGYNITEEIVIDENQKGNRLICKNMSDRTAIHIHMSDEQRVMMQVVGIGDEIVSSGNQRVNALVADSSDLTDADANSLLDKQEQFCKMHPKIIEELFNRGVIMNADMRNEPDIRYSKMIASLISARDYDVEEVEAQAKHKSEHAQRGARRSISKKKSNLMELRQPTDS